MMANRSTQTAAYLVGLGAMILLYGLWAAGLRGQVSILAPAVALLGLPHGALDMPMAETLWPLNGWRHRAIFLAGYLGLAGSIGLLWWLAPGAALAAFLAYSAVHFSGDWQPDGRLWQWAGGLSAVGAPAVFHLSEVAGLFAALGPVAGASTIATATAAAGLIGAGCAILAAILGRAARWPVILELAAIWLGAALLPPLLSFVVYFCLLHSLRHLTGTLGVLPERRQALHSAAGITALSLSGAALAALLLLAGAGAVVDAAMLQVVFIGLAALTVPHMLLVDRFVRTGPHCDIDPPMVNRPGMPL